MDVFDIDVTAKMQIMHVRPHWASSGKGQHQRDEKTQRDVAQSMRHNSILKLITVCKRFNIDVLHPQSMHMVLSLLCKTEDRLGQFERIHAQDALTNPVILDMPAVDSIEQIQHDLLYSLADWVNLFSYMHCVVPEEDARQLDGTLEVSFLWSLRGVVISGMVGSRLSRYIVRSVGIYFSQDHMCRMLKNV